MNPIKRARQTAGLTQTQVVMRTGITQTMLSRLETGAVSIDKTTVGTMRKLAAALGTTVDELITESE